MTFLVGEGGQIRYIEASKELDRALRFVWVRFPLREAGNRDQADMLVVGSAPGFANDKVFLQSAAWDEENKGFNFYKRWVDAAARVHYTSPLVARLEVDLLKLTFNSTAAMALRLRKPQASGTLPCILTKVQQKRSIRSRSGILKGMGQLLLKSRRGFRARGQKSLHIDLMRLSFEIVFVDLHRL
jgi:hypothetical protein